MKRLILVLGAAGMLLLWSCGAGHNHGENHGEHGAEAAAHDHLHHDAEEAAHHHDGEDPHDHDGGKAHGHTDEIVIPAEKAAAAGIVAETVVPGPFSGVIKTGGQIRQDRLYHHEFPRQDERSHQTGG